jgi:hypothetical protein
VNVKQLSRWTIVREQNYLGDPRWYAFNTITGWRGYPRDSYDRAIVDIPERERDFYK